MTRSRRLLAAIAAIGAAFFIPALALAQVGGDTAPSSPQLPYTAPAGQFVNGMDATGAFLSALPGSGGVAAMGTGGQGATSAALGAIATAAGAYSWPAAQRGAPSTITISTSTFTPNFNSANNFDLTLVHASCPCTLANPSTTPVEGQSGVFKITQSATGSDTIGTWGSLYVSAGGTSTITLSTGAGVVDTLPYYVQDATDIVLGSIIAGPTH